MSHGKLELIRFMLNKNRHSFDVCRFTLLSVPLLSPGTEFPKRDSVYIYIMLIIAKLYQLVLVTTIKTIKNVVLPSLFFFVLKWNKFKWWDQNVDTDIQIYERWRTSSWPMVEGVSCRIHSTFMFQHSPLLHNLSWTSTKCSTADTIMTVKITITKLLLHSGWRGRSLGVSNQEIHSSPQDKMLELKVSANHRYAHIYTSHRLCTTLTC